MDYSFCFFTIVVILFLLDRAQIQITIQNLLSNTQGLVFPCLYNTMFEQTSSFIFLFTFYLGVRLYLVPSYIVMVSIWGLSFILVSPTWFSTWAGSRISSWTSSILRLSILASITTRVKEMSTGSKLAWVSSSTFLDSSIHTVFCFLKILYFLH